jgi:hypothetical protein
VDRILVEVHQLALRPGLSQGAIPVTAGAQRDRLVLGDPRQGW